MEEQWNNVGDLQGTCSSSDRSICQQNQPAARDMHRKMSLSCVGSPSPPAGLSEITVYVVGTEVLAFLAHVTHVPHSLRLRMGFPQIYSHISSHRIPSSTQELMGAGATSCGSPCLVVPGGDVLSPTITAKENIPCKSTSLKLKWIK